MLNKNVVAIAVFLVLLTWAVPPWQQVSTNGTGDSVLTYEFRNYAPLWTKPPIDKDTLYSRFSKVWVQPDWLILVFEDVGILVVSALILRQRKHSKAELPES